MHVQFSKVRQAGAVKDVKHFLVENSFKLQPAQTYSDNALHRQTSGFLCPIVM